MTTLVMDAISKTFPGVRALAGVSIEGRGGEVIGLLGANGAGKSTLISILGGLVAPDEGRVLIDGGVADLADPATASRLGIELIHQELALLPALTVGENMFAERFPRRGPFIDRAAVRRRAREALGRVGSDLDPDTPVGRLTPAQRQLVEIARALVSDPRIVVFDEPTSSLSAAERDRLFDVIRELRQAGVLVLFISHFLDDVFAVCDRVYVLRDGQVIGSSDIAAVDRPTLIRWIVGHEPETAARERRAAAGQARLRVRGMRPPGAKHPCDFDLHDGEVVGLWGLLGSGRTELIRAVIGLDPALAGRLEIRRDSDWEPISPAGLLREVGFVPEDRRAEGLILSMSVRANVVLGSLRRIASCWTGWIDGRREEEIAAAAVEQGGIKVASTSSRVGTLSGGNQQKVVFARALVRRPQLWFLDEPTRGLDVGARAELHAAIREVARAGAATLIVSSDVEELLALGDRFLVIGRSGMLTDAGAHPGKERLMELAQSLDGAAA